MLAGGNAIGDHTWSHTDLRRLSVKERREEIVGTAQELNTTGSPTPTLVRPPYGSTNPTINRFIRSLGMLPINWNVDPDDWKANPVPSVDSIVAGVVDNASPARSCSCTTAAATARTPSPRSRGSSRSCATAASAS